MAGPVSADPTNAPGAISRTFTCGGVPVTLTVFNGSAAFTSSTSVGIAVGNVSLTPGFNHNGIQTVECTITLDGQLFKVTAFFTPPTKT
jgi:hypothetical protein